jgi:hypothetical protein
LPFSLYVGNTTEALNIVSAILSEFGAKGETRDDAPALYNHP